MTAQSHARVPWYRSLYYRLATAFALLFIIGSLLQLYLSAEGWRSLFDELDQQVYWDTAEEISLKLQPLLRHGVPRDALEREFYNIIIMNPKLEPFLLGENGELLYHLPDPATQNFAERIPLEPIRLALQPMSPKLPLYGANPRNVEQQLVFSAAEVSVDSRPGYLYLSLRNPIYDNLSRTTGQFYVFRSVFWGIAFALIVFVVLGLLLFRYLTRDLVRISQAVQDFGSGESSRRVNSNSQDEIGQLAQTFDRMAETIERTTAKLKSTDELRRTFVAYVSHDLQTPLTVLLGVVELFKQKRKLLSEEEQTHYLDLLNCGIQTQSKLVEDLFELSRLEAEGRKPKIEPVALQELGYEVLRELEPIAAEKSIKINPDFSANRSEVLADALMLKRVIYNLLNNAIKYTSEQGSVKFRLLDVGDLVEVRITDTGIGIAADALEHIFDSFYRAHQEGIREIRGTGLGLAIVKKILDLHQVPIHAASSPGEGTTFFFSLHRA